jgi:hypothetical protein
MLQGVKAMAKDAMEALSGPQAAGFAFSVVQNALFKL